MAIFARRVGSLDLAGILKSVHCDSPPVDGDLLVWDDDVAAFVVKTPNTSPSGVTDTATFGGANAHTVDAGIAFNVHNFKEIVPGAGIELVSTPTSLTISSNLAADTLSVSGDYVITIDNDADDSNAKFEIRTVIASGASPLVATSTTPVNQIIFNNAFTGQVGGFGFIETTTQDFDALGYEPGMFVTLAQAGPQVGNFVIGSITNVAGVSRIIFTVPYTGSAAIGLGGPYNNITLSSAPLKTNSSTELESYDTDFDAAGFASGQVMRIVDSDVLDGIYEIASVAGNIIEVSPGTPFPIIGYVRVDSPALQITTTVEEYETGTGFVVHKDGVVEATQVTLAQEPTIDSDAATKKYVDDTLTFATVATTGDYNDLINLPTVATTFLGLTDTPSAYTGFENRVVKVNPAGTGLIFSTDFVSSAVNLGTGTGVFASQAGSTLQFKSLVAGAGTNITSSSTEIVITATGVGALSLDDLSDVDLSVSPTIGQILEFDGTNWVAANNTGAGGGFDSVLDHTDTPNSYVGNSLDVLQVNAAEDGVTFTPLATVAFTGEYADLLNKPGISTVAITNDYNDLDNLPTLATVATTGDFNDLLNIPVHVETVSSGDATIVVDNTDPQNPIITVGTVPASQVSGLAAVATSGDYNDLSNLPVIPSLSTIDNIGDVDTSSVVPVNGDILVFNNISGNWEPEAPGTVSGGNDSFGVVIADSGTSTSTSPGDTLILVGGTDINTIAVGNTITIDFDGTIPADIEDLDNVDVTGAVNGSVLVFNNGTSTWEIGTNGSQDVFTTFTGDSGSTTANISADTLTIAGGTDITTSVVGDTLTIDFSGTLPTELSDLSDIDTTGAFLGATLVFNNISGKWEVGPVDSDSQNLFETVAADSGTTTANTPTDTLNIVGGTNITTTLVGDTLTIDADISTTVELTEITSTGDLTINPGGDTIIGGVTYASKVTIVIADNTTGGAVTTFPALNHEAYYLDYILNRPGDGFRTGSLFVTTNIATVQLSDVGVDDGDILVTFNAVINAGNVEITYDSASTGNSGTMSFAARWFAL